MILKFENIYSTFLSESVKLRIERFTLVIAIVSFLIHLAVIYSNKYGIVSISTDSEFFESPVAAIYTPFSFILAYEVYLLIYYLPRSITTYISKQYEIITLIVIRRLFKDLSNIELSSDWFVIKDDLAFTYDLVTALFLFLLIYLFTHQRLKLQSYQKTLSISFKYVQQFVTLKKWMATFLVPVLMILGCVAFGSWLFEAYEGIFSTDFKNVNNIFFDEFFTVLIIVDVMLLLFSFFYTDKFHKVIRNSGFVVSTILIRLSFSVDGLVNNCLIIGSIIFGLLILMIHNRFEVIESTQKRQ